MSSMSLKNKSSDPKVGVYFIGTTPPKQDTAIELVAGIADKLLNRLNEIDYDGLIVYDIQDETSRIDKPRPFPFKYTHDSRLYSKILHDKSAKPVITYKSVSQRDGADFSRWLSDAWHQFSVRDIVLVGSPSSTGDIKLSLADAYQTVEDHNLDFHLGGVAIAERHANKGDEHLRMIAKDAQGCEFFISQAVYNAQATIDMLTRYAMECKQQGKKARRVVLTFSPCGSAKTLEFIEWLGISVPEATSLRILQSENPLKESLLISQNNFEQILQACLPLGIPLGLNIESLTNRKEEIDAAILLFKLLKATLDLKLAESQL
ncbi:methylenetetrahydrofolate reductase [Psychromonas sp.]|uniref:methylenetetrahydrofolate reductase n=1 Tax=Psychromonas sp. TaxID=1884585 RepID=UPI003561D13D